LHQNWRKVKAGEIMESILEALFNDVVSKADDDSQTALNWLITAVVVAVVVAGLSFGYKALRKSMASHLDQKIWSRSQTWLSFFIGLFPVFIGLLAVWYLTRDFFNFVDVGPLLKGVVMAWILYLAIMILGHLVSPWRRELL
jgi:H+/Cl- antiporter ClcA